MPGMTITFILIAFPASPCCQLLFSYLTTHILSLSSVLVHSVTMMSSQTVFLALLVCFSVFSSSLCPHPSSAKKTGCFKVNNCKCIMKDGSGVINLKAMGDADGFLGRLKPVTADNMPVNAEILLSFSPCQAFSQPEDLTGSDCTSVAACLVVRYHRLNRYINHYISFGRHEGNEFHYNDTLKMLSVSYFGPEPESRGAPAHLGGEPLCLSKRLRHGRSGARYHLPHHPLCQRRCLLHPWLLRAEAFSEQQWIPDLSGAQCVVYDLLPLY